MKRPYNFGSGPAALPFPVMESIEREIGNFNQSGISILETSHRSEDFMALAEDNRNLIRSLLDLPESYSIIFFPGGATAQFSAIAMNFLPPNQKAIYINTGLFSDRAAQEARRYGSIETLSHYSMAHSAYSDALARADEAAYVYCCINETADGVAFQKPQGAKGHWVVDATTALMGYPFNYDDYGLIYASAQKLLGIAGLSVALVHEDFYARLLSQTLAPRVLDYRVQYDQKSLANTPDVFAWYVLNKQLHFIQSEGLERLMALNLAKSKIFYEFLETSTLYQPLIEEKEKQSPLNAVFQLREASLLPVFLKESFEAGFLGLKGHAHTGHCRVAFYHGVSMEAVMALIDFMANFSVKHGR